VRQSIINFADDSGGVAGNDNIIGHIVDHYAACAHDGARADRNPAHDRSIRSYGGPPFDKGWNNLPILFRLEIAGFIDGPRKPVINEHDPMTYEDLILNDDSLADEGVTLDFAILSDRCIFLDLDKRADPGSIAYGATVEVDEIIENDVFTEDHIGSNFFQFSHYIRQDLQDYHDFFLSQLPDGIEKYNPPSAEK
jgi:hypothetical protein